MSSSTFDTTKTPLQELLKDIDTAKMQLPDFQRGWVWDDERIRSLLASIAVSFPIGAVMLLETGGNDIKFKPRPVEGVKPDDEREPEVLILDGQQRLTSLYQSLMMQEAVKTITAQKKTKIERYYYFDMQQMVNGRFDEEEAILSVPADRQLKSDFGRQIAVDVSMPDLEYKNLLFPANKIFNPSPWRRGFNRYWNHDDEKSLLFDDFEEQVISRFKEYLVPIIKLFKSTPKEAVCLVFEKVNTGGVSLTVFELLTATFAVDNFQLRDDWQTREERLKRDHQVLNTLQSDDFLQAITLLVTMERRKRAIEEDVPGEKLPGISCKRKDILNLTMEEYKKWADAVEQGFAKAARFLHSQHIYRAKDLPYRTQLVPMAAAFVTLGRDAEPAGAQKRIARWYWSGVLGELYGGAVETRFARDLPDLVEFVRQDSSEPKTIQDANFDANRLLSLRTRNSAAYKGIHALLMKSRCKDFRTGDAITIQTFFDDNIDIHHIFPQKWCKDTGIKPEIFNSIINKTAIASRTNRIIGGQAPSIYLPKIERDADLSRSELSDILKTHGINPKLAYADDFWQFFAERGDFLVRLIEEAMGKTAAREGADFLECSSAKEEKKDERLEWERVKEVHDVDELEAISIENELPSSQDDDTTTADKLPSSEEMEELKQKFHQSMIDIYKTAKRELNYTASYFIQMVSELGGLETARRLLTKNELSEGFTELYLRDRLDLTVEAHVIKTEFRPLFTPQEIAIAKQRLQDMDYPINE